MDTNARLHFLISELYDSCLQPEHLEDLRRSGLTDQTIVAAKIRTIPPADLARFIGPHLATKVSSAMLIPYLEGNFYRVKLFPEVPDGDGHTIRYYQPAGTAPQLYLPSHARAALTNPATSCSLVRPP